MNQTNSHKSIEIKFSRALILLVLVIELMALFFEINQQTKFFNKTLLQNKNQTVDLISKLIEVPLGEFNIPEVQRILLDVSEKNMIISAKVLDINGLKLTEIPTKQTNDFLIIKKDVLSENRDGFKIGSIEIGVDLSDIKILSKQQFYNSVGISLFLILAIILTTHFLFKTFVTMPLRKLTTFARENANVEYLKKDFKSLEFQTLADVLLKMSNEVSSNTAQLENLVKDRTIKLESANHSLTQSLEDLKKTQEQLINNSKLAALGKMAAGIAHEINNPLTIIKSTASQLSNMNQNSSFEPDKLSLKTAKIIKMVDRITIIVSGMRIFSRADSDQPYTKNSSLSLFQESLELARIKFKSGNVALTNSEIPDIEIECRYVPLSQVVINLLTNAYDAVSDKDAPWVHLDVLLKDEQLTFLVTDSGSGIPADIAAKIMEPFFSTKEVGKGTGLGLSISLGIIQDHGGSITLDQECKNTRFVVTIPIKQTSLKT